MKRIFITSLGIISSIGNSLNENLQSLRTGKSGLSQIELFKTKYANTLRFGEIKIDNSQLKKNLKVNERGVTRTSLLAFQAANECIQNSSLTNEILSAQDTSLICASTVGGMCLTDELHEDANKKDQGSEYVDSYDCGSVGAFLQSKMQVGGIVNTINTACSSSANSIMYGARLIRNGFAKRVIAGGVDSLAKFTINGFNSLHILSEKNCRPFDEKRNGLNLGEAAGFLLLESEDVVDEGNIIAEITGYSNTNDAFHPSSLSDEGDGPRLAMENALTIAGLKPDQIDYINAHGTGTENNDLVESVAMKKIFDNVPAFNSTKSYTGHTLGAAGAIESIFCIMSLQHQEIYPGLNFSTPIPETNLKPETNLRKQQVSHVMSNSFGFGGNCSSVIFSKAN